MSFTYTRYVAGHAPKIQNAIDFGHSGGWRGATGTNVVWNKAVTR